MVSCVVCRGFSLDCKMLYLEPKHTFKEYEMVRNKQQEGSADGKKRELMA